jgi:predicted DNA-binding transcriptional regulator AlpA
MSDDDEERLVGFKTAIAMAGVSRAELYRRIEAEKFPAPIKDGEYRNSRALFSMRALRRYVKLKLAGEKWTPEN